jgi:chromosome segregation ATPase
LKALLKVKDTEEKLMKSDADKRIVQEKLSGEIRKLKGNWDHFEQSLGSRSSYAIKASQSVRAFVELIEEQKLELESQVRIMKANVESLQTKVHSLEQSKAQLKNEIEQLQTDIKEKVTVAAGAELKALRLQCNALQNESKTAKERCQLLEEQNKREQEARRSVEEQLLKEKSQVQIRGGNSQGMQVRAVPNTLLVTARLNVTKQRLKYIRQRLKSTEQLMCPYFNPSMI